MIKLSVYENVLEMIGNTPCIRLKKIENKYNLNNEIYAKIEKNNPGGSIKDRVAYLMIEDGIKKGLIDNNTTIIEATSGNTGIGLAMVCSYYKLKLIIVMSENVSSERIKLIKLYGARVILTDKKLGIEGAINKANLLKKEITNSYYINQFENTSNIETHYKYTANEILKEFGEKIDFVFVGMGSSGTIMGISKRLKLLNNKIKIIGIEPSGCPYYIKKEKGKYKIPGIGTTFMPKIANLDFVDDIELVEDDEAENKMLELLKEEGMGVGYSSGAVLSGMIKYIKSKKIKNKKIILIFPDSIERYLSML